MVEVKGGKEFIEKVEYGKDLLGFIEDLVKKRRVKAGILTAIGAVQEAKIKYYDQKGKRYRSLRIDEPMELLSCVGNVSTFEGDTIIHCHVVLGDKNGRAYGGHLDYGTRVFSCEMYLREFEGVGLKRKYDQITGLNLLDI